MIPEVDAAYIAGLFDGEGNVNYAKRREKKKRRNGKVYETNCWRISMEISMTDKSVLTWLHQVLGVGTLNPKPRKNGHQMQYRWRCVFRDAYYVCLLIWPFAHTKLPQIQKVIEHYTVIGKDNVIDLNKYKEVHVR